MIPRNVAVAVTTAGTRVPLSGSTLMVSRFIIQAEHDNTGRIYVGGSSVAASNGLSLDAKQYLVFDPPLKGPSEKTNLADWYIDASVNTDGVTITYFTEE